MLMRPDMRVQQRDLLLEISRAITAQLDLSEVLRRVLYASVAMLVGRVGLIALRNESDELYYVRAISGIPRDLVPDLDEKLREMVTDAEGGMDYEYVNTKLKAMAAFIDESLQQSIGIPLVFAEQPLGILIIFRSYQATITEDDLIVLQSFADQAAIAVHNAQLYQNIKREQEQLDAILNHSGDGVFILDRNLRILQTNRALEKITGWSISEAVGLQQQDIIHWEQLDQEDLPEALEQGWPSRHMADLPVETLYVQGDIQRRDGLTTSIGITYAPVLDEDEHLTNIIANVRDISNIRKAQEMQNTFISTIHHELRTPIAIIKGYASTLNREDADWDSTQIRQNLTIIEEEADRLTKLVEDLLTASKIQAEQGVTLNMSDVRLNTIAARSVERLSSQHSAHDIELSFPDQFPVIQGDELRLRQVIDNLLTNAIKYSPKNRKITVGGRFSDKWVSIFVRDEGMGIPEAEQEQIFERFYRIDDRLTRKTQGTGLGLFLSKAIIEAHHGTIHIKSQPDHGSTFYFTLPRD